MGNFYANHTVCGPDLGFVEQIKEIRPAYVVKAQKDCLVVFDQLSESQYEGILENTNKLLSNKPDTVALSVVIHDDDIMMYWLSKESKLLQTYNSNPNYFGEGDPLPPEGGDAAELCKVFGSGDPVVVSGILSADMDSEKYVFQTDRHKDLVTALGLPELAAGMSYSYIDSGDLLKGVDASNFKKLE